MFSLKSPSVGRALRRGNRLDEYEKNFVLKILRKRPEIARGESYKTNLIRNPSWTLVPNLMLARFLTVIPREGSKKISMSNPTIVSFMMSMTVPVIRMEMQYREQERCDDSANYCRSIGYRFQNEHNATILYRSQGY
jgi:hypothetical protein